VSSKSSGILVGWKDIARYLGVSVETAVTYEAERLPVYRIRGHVRALKSELEAWVVRTGRKMPQKPTPLKTPQKPPNNPLKTPQ